MPLFPLLLAAATPACSMADPGGCATTAELLALPGVAEQVRALAGERRANYLYAGLRPVAAQAREVLGGPPDKPKRIANGWLFAACRLHSCGEKGAVIVDEHGKVAALGILHARCAVEQAKPGCGRDQALALYGGEDLPGWRATLVRWAKGAGGAEDLPVSVNGIGDAVTVLAGEFDGDKLPDEAALTSGADASYTVTIKRGVNGKTMTIAPAAVDAALAQGEGGTLLFGQAGAMRRVRWNGKAFAVGNAQDPVMAR